MRLSRITLGCLGIASLCLAVSVASAQEKEAKPAQKPGEFKTVKERFSYGVGRNIGGNIKTQELDVDIDALAQGIRDALSGAESRVSEEEMQAAMKVIEKEMIAKAKTRREEMALKRIAEDPELKAQAEKNTTDGAAFLKENQGKDGVKVTASGLQYQVLKEGKGEKPKSTDVVKTHYHGTFPDGKVFDSSVERKEPAVFPVDGVIEGWTEALQLMPVGSKWRLVIPAKLAYGASGSGGRIGPHQVLVFEVELLGIESANAEEGGQPTEPAPKSGGNQKQ